MNSAQSNSENGSIDEKDDTNENGKEGSENDDTVELDWRYVATLLSGQQLSTSHSLTHVPDRARRSAQLSRKCPSIRIVDIVVLNDKGEVDSWIFTSKSGHIASKKKVQDQTKIVERFAQFALSNPHNTERYVALVRNERDQQKGWGTVFDQAALEEAISTSGSLPELKGTTLHCYLRPQNGSNCFLRGCYNTGDLSVSLESPGPLFGSAKKSPRPPFQVSSAKVQLDQLPEKARLQQEAGTVLVAITDYIQANLSSANCRVRCCDADFVLDDNGELWFLSLPRLTVATSRDVDNELRSCLETTSVSSLAPAEDEVLQGAPEFQALMSTATPRVPVVTPLPNATQIAPVEGGRLSFEGGCNKQDSVDHSLATSPEKCATKIDAERPPKSGALPNILSSTSAPGERKSTYDDDDRKTAVIEKKNGVYVSNVHASALRGLCSWQECSPSRASGSRGACPPRWRFDASRYKGNRAAEESRPRDDHITAACRDGISFPGSFNEQSTARHKLTARSVLLAIAGTSFLRGEEPLDATEGGSNGGNDEMTCRGSLARRWEKRDREAQLSLAGANPQAYYDEVTVCGNCMEICRKLDSIRAAGFPDERIDTPETVETVDTVDAIHAVSGLGSRGRSLRPSSEPLPDVLENSGAKGRPATTAAEDSQTADRDCREGRKHGCERDPDRGGGAQGDSFQSHSIMTSGSDQGAPDPAVNSALTTSKRLGGVEAPEMPGNESHRVGDKDGRDGEEETSEAKPEDDTNPVPSFRKEAGVNNLNHIPAVYGVKGKYGRGKAKGGRRNASRKMKSRPTPNEEHGAGRLDVTAVARFALERERLAKEMGMDELSGPATLGVVNVGAGGGPRQKRIKLRPGAKHAPGHTDGANGTDHDGDKQNDGRKGEKRDGGRSAGEILLEKLESVAEARASQGRASGQDCKIRSTRLDGDTLKQNGMEGQDRKAPHGRKSGSDGQMGKFTMTESDFLQRSSGHIFDQVRLMSTTGKGPMFGTDLEDRFRDLGVNTNDQRLGGDGKMATINALRDRLTEMEAENSALRARARRAEEERATEAARGDKAHKKLAQARAEFARAMSEKDEDHRLRELALEEKHSRELARISQSCADEMANPPSEKVEEPGIAGGSLSCSNTRNPNKTLISRLEHTLKEMAEQQRHFAESKRQILADKAQEVAAAEAKGRRELEEARSLAAAMEDRASALQEQVTDGAKHISTLKAREEEQKRRRIAAEEEADKVRKDMGIMRQAVQQSLSMDLTDEAGGRQDGKSTLAAVTATSEARIRTLNNKVEFLKAQLASEQTLKAEVEASLALSQKNVFEAKNQVRKQVVEADKAREVAVEEAVARVKQQMEESLSEAYRVQSKVQVLQDQLNDALGDVSLTRRREENLKAELVQTTTKLEDRTAELAKAQSRADELAAAQTADAESSADRAAREATIRRLDNERQYLKSQLESEVTCKDELREALATATRQLGEIKAKWTNEKSERIDAFQRELQKKSDEIGDLEAEKVSMEAELVAATRQLALLKDGYSKARENLRGEQVALETVRTANRRFKEQIHALAEEVAVLRKEGEEGARRHSQSLLAARTALDEAEETKRKQIVDQQLQLREQILKTNEVQRELMALQENLNDRERESNRMIAAERVAQGLARWCRNRGASAFYLLVTGTTIAKAEKGVQERRRRALLEAGETARRAQEAAVEAARQEVEDAFIRQMEEAERVFKEERTALLKDIDAAAAATASKEKVIQELKELEETRGKEIEKIRAEAKTISAKHREKMALLAKEAEERTQTKVQLAIQTCKETCAKEAEETLQESDERWRIVLREHLDKAQEDAASATASLNREHAAAIENAQMAFQLEREKLKGEAEGLVAAALTAEREKGAEREAQARKSGAEEAAASYEITRERDLLAAREECSRKLEEAAVRAEGDANMIRKAEEEARRRVSEEANAAMHKLEKQLADARDRAVKLESGKWKRASEEAEARAAAEQAAAYERGVADRGRQAEAEAKQLQEAAEKALEEVKQGARSTIEEMAARHAEDLDTERRRVREEEITERKKELEDAKNAWANQQAKAIVNARAAASAEATARAERERASAVEAAKERGKLATEKVQEEFRSAKTEWAAERRQMREKQSHLEEAEKKAKEDLLKAMVSSNQAAQRARLRMEEGQRIAMEKAAAQAVDHREMALEDARRAFNRDKKRALMEAEESFAAQAEAMSERLKNQATSSLQQAEDAHAKTREEKDSLARELEERNIALKEREMVIYHTQEDAKEQSIAHSIRTWRLVSRALELGRGHKKSIEILRAEAAARESEMEASKDRLKRTFVTDIEELLRITVDSSKRFEEMREVLVNYKREVLVDHKVQSASLHKELDNLARQRDQLDEQRLVLQKTFRDLKCQAKEVEKEAHAHSRQSAIGPDGMVIPARAHKKRRLDEELEAILEAMEAKREALLSLDKKLSELGEARSAKDDEMKELEKSLVQVLVEQQKKLLVVLNEVSATAKPSCIMIDVKTQDDIVH